MFEDTNPDQLKNVNDFWKQVSIMSLENYLNSIKNKVIIDNDHSAEVLSHLRDRLDDIICKFNSGGGVKLTTEILELAKDLRSFATYWDMVGSLEYDDSGFFRELEEAL